MKHHIALTLALALTATTAARAGQLNIREQRLVPLSQPGPTSRTELFLQAISSGRYADTSVSEPDPYLLYPVAGVLDRDVYIPYYVDLDPSPGVLAFNCTHLSYNGNTGEDPYIRSFREEDIGVPVFAAIDGTVVEVHQGEPDHNTDSNPKSVPNYVAILHGGNQRTDYLHLRADVLVKVGDVVSAGTQIGWVGSSGQSSGPHIHFESQFNDIPYEPMSGPCRAGHSNFVAQPAVSTKPFVAGVVLSRFSFDNLPLPPNDPVTPTGTFLRGVQNIYLRTDLANLYSATDYTLQLTSPDGTVSSGSGSFSQYQQEFLAAFFGLSVNLDTPGTWTLALSVDGTKVATIPFTVVSSAAEIVNHPPSALNASIDPISSGGVAICRTNNGLLADPDYDILTYNYAWTVNGSPVRTARSAARTDALPQQYATPHAQLSCSVTASDGQLQTQVSQAFAEVAEHRRRAVGH